MITDKIKTKVTTEQSAGAVSKGIVLNSDGGARAREGMPANQSCIGWGVHGYVFENSVPKKGAGADNNFLTKTGYVIKGENNSLQTSVKPLYYIDGFGSYFQLGTNNAAELLGAKNGLIKAKDICDKYTEEDGAVKSVVLYTDSKYVVDGLNEWSHAWVARNWIRTDGTPVPNAQEWRYLLQAHKDLVTSCPDTTVAWVKGHGDSLGNNVADKLATTAVMYSLNEIDKIDFTVKEADGYWKKETTKHPFLSHRRIYFNTLTSANNVGEYYTGDSEDIGKKSADTSYALVQLMEPDKVIECVREKFCEQAAGMNTIVVISADKLYSPEVYNDMLEHGNRIIPFYKKGMITYTLGGVPLAEEISPPRLAFRAVDSMSTLASLLQVYKDKDPDLTVVDITNVIYEEETKKKKNIEVTSLKLKSTFIVGFRALPYKFKIVTDKGTVELNITITLGIDLPERNALKQLESLSPKVSLVAWQEAPDVARYAVVIESMGSFSVWSGIHSNLIIITPDKYIA